VNEFQAAVEELAADIDQRIAGTRAAYQAVGAIEATAQSADGMISVTVGPQGRLRDIRLHPRAYRHLSPSELAGAILEQAARATADVAEQRRRLIAPLMPEELPYDEVFGQGVTLDAFLPPPVDGDA
jgi:hypothetical protein